MDTIEVQTKLFYYLLGYFVYTEKVKAGFSLPEGTDVKQFIQVLGYTTYEILYSKSDKDEPAPTPEQLHALIALTGDK